MAYQKQDLAQSRYEIALALGYVDYTASWAIPYSTVEHLKWNVSFDDRCMRENSRQFSEHGFQAKVEAEREARQQAWLERRAKAIAAEMGA